MNHILVIRSLPSLGIRSALYVSKVYIQARPASAFFGNTMMPMLLSGPHHHKHISITNHKVSLRCTPIDAVTRRPIQRRPHVGHSPHLKGCFATETQASYCRRGPEKRPAIGMPRNLIIAIKVQSQKHSIEGRCHFQIPTHFVHQWLQPIRHGLIRRVF